MGAVWRRGTPIWPESHLWEPTFFPDAPTPTLIPQAALTNGIHERADVADGALDISRVPVFFAA